MHDIASLLHDPDSTVAVVGANDNPEKYGSVIYRDLKRKGYRIWAVNPNRDTVDGDPCYPSVSELPGRPTIVNFVVPPDQTLVVLKECLEQGLMNVWLQPGSESAAVMQFVQDNDFTYLANACIMVQSRLKV